MPQQKKIMKTVAKDIGEVIENEVIIVDEKQHVIDFCEEKKIDTDVVDQVVEDPIVFCMEEINDATLSVDSLVKPVGVIEPIICVSTNAEIKADQEKKQCQVDFVDFLGLEQFEFAPNFLIADILIQLKCAGLSWRANFLPNFFLKSHKKLKYFKYLFLWNG